MQNERKMFNNNINDFGFGERSFGFGRLQSDSKTSRRSLHGDNDMETRQQLQYIQCENIQQQLNSYRYTHDGGLLRCKMQHNIQPLINRQLSAKFFEWGLGKNNSRGGR